MSRDPFDPTRYGESSKKTQVEVIGAPIKQRQEGLFLKGPIPWNWLVRAMSLPGRSLHVAIVLWQLAGMRKSKSVPLSLSKMGSYGVSQASASRGLKELEGAGLVSVDRTTGRKSLVTIRDAPAPESVGDGR
jgi:DNA-binding transcriptional ArsR family regulator